MARLSKPARSQESFGVEPHDNPLNECEPLEYFQLGRRIRQQLARCTDDTAGRSHCDISYLWLQLGAGNGAQALTEDHMLNIIDEAASLGTNWLVVTLADCEARAHVPALGRWAHETHGMVVCLHAPDGKLHAVERSLLEDLPTDSRFLLVEPEHRDAFSTLAEAGVHVGMASPPAKGDEATCEYPHRMIFVDAQGHLYTCGLVSGESDYFLGSVFDGSLDEIIHNPALPHSIPSPTPSNHRNCSGCPPLVAKYLCNR